LVVCRKASIHGFSSFEFILKVLFMTSRIEPQNVFLFAVSL
jgi:hypothetical protein